MPNSTVLAAATGLPPSRRALCLAFGVLPLAGITKALAVTQTSAAHPNDLNLAAPAIDTTRPANAMSLSIDAVLIALVESYLSLNQIAEAEVDNARFDALVDLYLPLEDEIAAMPAASMAGILAKARACQIPSLREIQVTSIPFSLADDLLRLRGEGGRDIDDTPQDECDV